MQCEERARKLRAELAVEEHRELELSKILNGILPEPKTPQVQKPRAVRKVRLETVVVWLISICCLNVNCPHLEGLFALF